MHLLLPPSEAKAGGGRGRPLRDRIGGDGALAAGRRATTSALLELVSAEARRAAAALLLPDAVTAAALEANRRVLDSPTMPALRRYAGVVYDGLGYARLDAAQQRVAARSTLIFSGLFGVVRGDEAVPDYRVPAKATLPGIGVASTFWRPVLTDVLEPTLRRGLIVDLRSGDYAAMWRPAPSAARRVVAVRILSPVPRGGHGVISFTSKLAKGRLAAALIRRATDREPTESAADVARAWQACGGLRCETTPTGLDLYTG